MTRKIKDEKALQDQQASAASVEHAAAKANCQAAVTHLGPTLTAALDGMACGISRFMEVQGFWECENFGEKIALLHSELSEALEADRKGLGAEHILGFSGVEEELADVFIRLLDLASYKGLRLGEAVQAKMLYNLSRPFKHGKAY